MNTPLDDDELEVLEAQDEAGFLEESDEPEYSPEEEFLPAAKREFHVTDESSASWVVAELLNCDAEEARVKRQAEIEIRRIDRKRQFFNARFGPELEHFARTRLRAVNLTKAPGKEVKSVKVASGTISFRDIKTTIEILSKDVAVSWAGKFCKAAIKLAPVHTELKKYFEENGEVPDGCQLVPAREKMNVSKPRGS